MKNQTEKLNDEAYIPYSRPQDAADKHLEVNSFQKEAANATLDLASRGQTTKREKPRQVSPKSECIPRFIRSFPKELFRYGTARKRSLCLLSRKMRKK